MLTGSLRCSFQAHPHTTFQQLTFAHTETGQAFCCFFCGLFFGLFILFLSQHMLFNSQALSCSTGWLLPPFLSADTEIRFSPLTWIFGLCSRWCAWFRFWSSLPPSSSRKVEPEVWFFGKCYHSSEVPQAVRSGCAGGCCTSEGVVQTHGSQCFLSYFNLL